MGSFGDVVLNCTECGIAGKCIVDDELLAGYPPLWAVDDVGILCDRCLKQLPEDDDPWSAPADHCASAPADNSATKMANG